MPPPGQGWLTGASSTSPETRSAWSSARFRASAPAPGMADDDHALDADFPERRADDPRLRRRRGGLGAADAVAPAAARPVDGDDPEAPRQPLAERRHGIARGAGGAVQEKHRRVGLAPLRRHLDDVQAPARDLDEAAGRRMARLDDTGDDQGRDGAAQQQQHDPGERDGEKLHRTRAGSDVAAVDLGRQALDRLAELRQVGVDRERLAIGFERALLVAAGHVYVAEPGPGAEMARLPGQH